MRIQVLHPLHYMLHNYFHVLLEKIRRKWNAFTGVFEFRWASLTRISGASLIKLVEKLQTLAGFLNNRSFWWLPQATALVAVFLCRWELQRDAVRALRSYHSSNPWQLLNKIWYSEKCQLWKTDLGVDPSTTMGMTLRLFFNHYEKKKRGMTETIRGPQYLFFPLSLIIEPIFSWTHDHAEVNILPSLPFQLSVATWLNPREWDTSGSVCNGVGNLLFKKCLQVFFAVFFIFASILLPGNPMLPSRAMMLRSNMAD